MKAYLTMVLGADRKMLDALNLTEEQQKKLVKGNHTYKEMPALKENPGASAQYNEKYKRYEFVQALDGCDLPQLAGLAAHETEHFLNSKKAHPPSKLQSKVVGVAAGLATMLAFKLPLFNVGGILLGAIPAIVTGVSYFYGRKNYNSYQAEKQAYRQQGIAEYAFTPNVTMNMILDDKEEIKSRKNPVSRFLDTMKDKYFTGYPSRDKRDQFINEGKEHACASGMKNNQSDITQRIQNTFTQSQALYVVDAKHMR